MSTGARRGLGEGVWPFVTKAMFRRVLGHVGQRPPEFESIAFSSDDGSRLEGMLARAHDNPRRVVVLCHPFTRHGFEFFFRGPLLSDLQRGGAHVVLFNFKGFGRSGFLGSNFADDVVGALDYAREHFPGLPVYLLGLSFGAFHAVGALARRDGQVTAAVLDSAPLTPSNFFRRGPAHLFLRWIGRSRWAALTGTEPISRNVGPVVHTRMCFVYGERDEYVDMRAVDDLLRDKINVELLTLPGVGHLEALKKDPNGYLSLIGHVLSPSS